ncbi:hypothetical protein ACWD7C_30080 [Streptomyces sp. NPDC005134]|uniref:hypothetical protein n=1 Tax=Streptomyces sp. NPDC005098 TaxID=3154560 RepID=UPI0033BBB7FA
MNARKAVPQPRPGCGVCNMFVRDWIAVTEPASPAFSTERAAKLVDQINAHKAGVFRHPF